ncbi:MAG TPA: alpha/beta hydrolase [Kribbella sp.]|nr:alpha/beta hydrolase [Kribbella sp.]
MTGVELIRQPGFEGESSRLLDLIGKPEPFTYETLRAARSGEPDPALSGSPDPRAEVAELYLPLRGGPTAIRLHRVASRQAQPLLLWLHGGGFVGGAAKHTDPVCSRLAVEAGVTVASLEYRLAPEDPFPAALHDTYDALRWLIEHGTMIGGDGRVAAGGQSAGGNLVAAACLLARDDRLPAVSRQILCYPVLDFGSGTESARLFDGDFLSAEADEWSDRQYLAGQEITPYVAPLRAETLAGLPPTLVIGAGRDPLRDDARQYAARLRADGVDVRQVEYEATMHAFLSFSGGLSAAGHAVRLIADDLKVVFSL